ncbi:MAG: YbhB/YbcL family Raf kinase inhibitor-like protein, partial [Deinococcus sp.]
MNKMMMTAGVACTALLAGCAPALMGQGAITAAAPGRLSVAQPAPRATAGTLTLSSLSFRNGGMLSLEQVGQGNGCTGQNISPELNWSGAPEGTASFVLTAYDPDAPTGSGFWHWAVYN